MLSGMGNRRPAMSSVVTPASTAVRGLTLTAVFLFFAGAHRKSNSLPVTLNVAKRSILTGDDQHPHVVMLIQL